MSNYHPCTYILIEALKDFSSYENIEKYGASAYFKARDALIEWDHTRQKVDDKERTNERG